MISSIFLLDGQGDIIARMNFSETVSWRDLERLWGCPPDYSHGSGVLRYHGGTYSTFVRHKGVVVLATMTEESFTAQIVGVLKNVIKAIECFLKDFSENVLRDNFSTVYQILQEMLDYGYPLITHLYQLEHLVSKPTLEHKVRQILDAQPNDALTNGLSRSRLPLTSAGGSVVAPWRDPRAHHSHSEILFDVVERVDCLMNSDGHVTHAAVRGSIEVDCRLNGTPDVTLRLSTAMPEAGLHFCVRAGQFETDGSLSFIPPDGRFTLCQYMATPMVDTLHPSLVPFYVTPQLVLQDARSGRGSFTCLIGWRGGGAPLDGPNDVRELSVHLRFPRGVSSVQVEGCNKGTARFARQEEVLHWTVGTLNRTTPSLNGFFHVENDAPSLGISAEVEFELCNYTLSAVRINSVQVSQSSASQKFYKGVKYQTRSGDFVIRSA